MFVNSIIYLVMHLELGRYICATCENWDKHKSEDEFVASNKEDEETKNIRRTFRQSI